MAIVQAAYRFGSEDGTEATHGFLAALNTPIVRGHAGTFFLRVLIQCTAGTAAPNGDYLVQRSVNGGAFGTITTTTPFVKAVTTAIFANAANTTSRLGGTGTFEASSQGCSHDGDAGGAQFDIVADGCGEVLYSLQLDPADLTDGDVITFRLLFDGAASLTYTVTPQITFELNTGTAAGTIAAVTAAAEGAFSGAVPTGTAAASLAATTGTASGLVEVEGPAAASLAATTAASTGQEIFTGAAAATRSAVTAASTAAFGPSGIGASNLTAVIGSATGQETFVGTAATTLSTMTASATEGLGVVTGTSTAALAAVAGMSSGFLVFTGITGSTVPALTANAAGESEQPPTLPPAWRTVPRAARSRVISIAGRF